MAVNYANLFEEVGKLIKIVDQIRQAAIGGGGAHPDLPSLQDELRNAFDGNNNLGIWTEYDLPLNAAKDTLANLSASMAARVTARLTHRETVVNELTSVVGDMDIQHILEELDRDMTAVGQSFEKSTVGFSGINNYPGNAGTASVYLTGRLDGVSAPNRRALPSERYADRISHLAVPFETMSLTCTRDSDADFFSEGQERFRLEGTAAAPLGSWDWRHEGSGESVELAGIEASDIIRNPTFTLWDSANVPSNWEITDGGAGMHVVEETVNADVLRGSSSLELVGDGALPAIRLLQSIDIRQLTPRRRYACALWFKGNAGFSQGTLTARFFSASNGYVATPGETITLPAIDLQSSSWDVRWFELSAPTALPDDLVFELKLAGTPTVAASIHIGAVAVGPFTYANGIGVAVSPGAQQIIRGDRWTWNVSHIEKVFSRFFRRMYAAQLPTDVNFTIDDSLAS